MSRTERERLSAAARECDRTGVKSIHFDTGYRPRIRPRPRLRLAAGGNGFLEGPLEQDLCNQRLGVDVGALAEQNQAGESENEWEDEAGHWHLRHCPRQMRSVCAGERSDEAIRLAAKETVIASLRA